MLDPDNIYDETYSQIYYGTEELLAQLFSKEKVEEFRSNLPIPAAWSGGRNYAAEIRSYKNHIGTCIALLKSYREHIEDFWPSDNNRGSDTKGDISLQPGFLPIYNSLYFKTCFDTLPLRQSARHGSMLHRSMAVTCVLPGTLYSHRTTL